MCGEELLLKCLFRQIRINSTVYDSSLVVLNTISISETPETNEVATRERKAVGSV